MNAGACEKILYKRLSGKNLPVEIQAHGCARLDLIERARVAMIFVAFNDLNFNLRLNPARRTSHLSTEDALITFNIFADDDTGDDFAYAEFQKGSPRFIHISRISSRSRYHHFPLASC